MYVVINTTTKKVIVTHSDYQNIQDLYLHPEYLVVKIPDKTTINSQRDDPRYYMTLAELKVQRKNETKVIAMKKIYAVKKDWEQRNLLEQYVELINKKVDNLALTQAEIDEIASIRNIWKNIKSIRSKADIIEAEIDTKSTVDEVYNYDIENSALWL